MGTIHMESSLSRERELLEDFDAVVCEVFSDLEARFGADHTPGLAARAREEFRRLIPELPDVGGKQPFTRFILATGWFLALYRVMQEAGGTVQDAGEIAFELTRTSLEKSPKFVRQVLGRVSFPRRYRRKVRKRAEASQLRRHPDSYVYSYLEGDGVSFDYGVDYHECATLKFLQAQGAPELAPYICALDFVYSEHLNWGLTRTTTLAEGGDRCDFRFKKGGSTRIRSTVLDLGEV